MYKKQKRLLQLKYAAAAASFMKLFFLFQQFQNPFHLR